jgi:D-arabinose 1-dehydrogenase-like Zn-dependent alcohol dehydrogenase
MSLPLEMSSIIPCAPEVSMKPGEIIVTRTPFGATPFASPQNLCSTAQGTIVGRHGGFADRVRAQWTWVRPIPDGLDLAKAGPLLCGGVTVFAPFLIHNVPSTARVGVIGIGGLGHIALQFANKWGCEVHAFTTSDSKEAEAHKLGAHYVHNTKQDGALKKIASSLDLIISTISRWFRSAASCSLRSSRQRCFYIRQINNSLS